MHAANRMAWDEAAERYEGWFDESVAQIRGGGSNLFPVEHALIGDLHGRCRRAIHVQCAGGRDTLSLWNLGADEVVGVDFSPRMLELRPPAVGGHGRAGPLGRGGRARHSARPGRDRGPPVHRARIADVAAGPGRVGSRAAPAPGPPGSPRDLRGPPGGVAVHGGRGRQLGPHRLRLLRRPGGLARLAPAYIDRLSLPDEEQHWKFARAWTLGEVITALLRSGLRLDEVAEHPVDWWAGHRDVRPEERGRFPLSFSVTATRGD